MDAAQRTSGVRLVGGRGVFARELVAEVDDLDQLAGGLSDLVRHLEAEVGRARAELAVLFAEREEIERRRERRVAEIVRDLERESARVLCDVERGAAECEALDRVRDDVAAETRMLMERCVALDIEVNHATALYVASERLRATRTRDEVVVAIEEVAATLIGCEEVAIFEVEPPTRALRVVYSVGVAADELARVDPAAEPLSLVLASGSVWIAPSFGARPGVGRLSACAPLAEGEQVVGVVAMFGLLEQKGSLDGRDRELLDLLSRHAGHALCAASPPGTGGAHQEGVSA